MKRYSYTGDADLDFKFNCYNMINIPNAESISVLELHNRIEQFGWDETKILNGIIFLREIYRFFRPHDFVNKPNYFLKNFYNMSLAKNHLTMDEANDMFMSMHMVDHRLVEEVNDLQYEFIDAQIRDIINNKEFLLALYTRLFNKTEINQ